MMIIEEINSPQDLKRLPLSELKKLCAQIRKLIIEVVSERGGHLASSLGAVELCVAIHYCLDAPRDTIIFDVSHQAYAHKIITGRRDAFRHLRQQGGISGFTSRQESLYDEFIAGHASTAISWAQGIAEAKRLKKETSKTVAIIGDGSLTGGMCFEALNNCGHNHSDVFIILNHNEMSISASVGALSNYLTKIISLPIYNKIKSELEVFMKHLPFAKHITHSARKFEEAIKGLIVPGLFFEELEFRYFGPIDGHNLDVLIPTIRNVSHLKGPRILHVITKKGKGYRLAEEDAERFHSAARFDIATGEALREQEESFAKVFAAKLCHLAQRDARIIAITAAMPKGTGLSMFKERFPEKFFDVGIAEEHAVGFAAGLARAGLRPYVAIYSTFLQRSFDQIIHDVALQGMPVVLCIDRAGFVGEDGPTHHGVFDIAYLRIIPNMVLMAPKDSAELEAMLELSLRLDRPTGIRYPKGFAYSLGKPEEVVLGKAQVMREGRDVCMLALGSLVKEALDAAASLAHEGISVFLVNMRFIKPLDEDLLKYIATRFRKIITLEEGILDGGFGSSILEFYERKRIADIHIERWGIPCEFSTFGRREDLLKMYGLDSVSLRQRTLALMKDAFVRQSHTG